MIITIFIPAKCISRSIWTHFKFYEGLCKYHYNPQPLNLVAYFWFPMPWIFWFRNTSLSMYSLTDITPLRSLEIWVENITNLYQKHASLQMMFLSFQCKPSYDKNLSICCKFKKNEKLWRLLPAGKKMREVTESNCQNKRTLREVGTLFKPITNTSFKLLSKNCKIIIEN